MNGRAHALELAFGNAAGEHQPLGAAADRAVERADLNLAGTGFAERFVDGFRRGRGRHTTAPRRPFAIRSADMRVSRWTWRLILPLYPARAKSCAGKQSGERRDHARSSDRAGVATTGEAGSLARRRALFAALAGATMLGLLWLAASAVPPHGPAP